MEFVVGDAALCPNCRSSSVRWRSRRFYDIMFTWLRFFVDGSFSAILQRHEAPYEEKIGLTTAKRFWKCPDCKKKGQVFSELDEVLSTHRDRLPDD